VEPSVENTDSIVLRFSDGTKHAQGIVAGRAPNSDIFIDAKGVSTMHLAFTFDDHGRPMVKDLESSWGTKVVFPGDQDSATSSSRKGFIRKGSWLLTGPSILTTHDLPVLSFSWNLAFLIYVPDRDYTGQQWRNNVGEFRRQLADMSSLLGAIDLASGSATQPATGQTSPAPKKVVYYRKEVARGAFGKVIYIWNPANDEEFAIKTPLSVEQSRAFVHSEIKILMELDHVSRISPWRFHESDHSTGQHRQVSRVLRRSAAHTHDGMDPWETTHS
jgi:hypothetical protein